MDDQHPKLTLCTSLGNACPEISAADLPSSGDSDGEFEFEFSVGSPAFNSGDPADDIFSNGRILPVYPVFNRDLLSKSPDPDPRALRSGSASSTSSAESVEIEAPAGAYCAWAPRSVPQSPDRAACKKSSSTGSGSGSATSRRWRVTDFIGGRRSHSDGKEKFVFLSANNAGSSSGPDPKPKAKPNPKPTKEMDLITAHRLFYGKDKKAAAEKGSAKRSFLPYRPELVGLFANSRAHHSHPFNF